MRAAVETSGFIGIVMLSKQFYPSKKWEDENIKKLKDTEVILYNQSDSLVAEAKALLKKAEMKYTSIISNQLRSTDLKHLPPIRKIDIQEFVCNILGTDENLLGIDQNDNSIFATESDDVVSEEYKVIPEAKLEDYLHFDEVLEPTFLQTSLTLYARYTELREQIIEDFTLHLGRINVLKYNRLISDVIGPHEAERFKEGQRNVALLSYLVCSTVLQVWWPLAPMTTYGNKIHTAVPFITRLPFMRGIAVALFSLLGLGAIDMLLAQAREEIEINQRENLTYANDGFSGESSWQRTDEIVMTPSHVEMPVIYPGGTIADPLGVSRQQVYLIAEPLFQELSVRFMLFSRLIHTGASVRAYLLTAIAETICFQPNPAEDPAVALYDLDDIESPALTFLRSLAYTGLYHAFGFIVVPLLVNVADRASVLLEEFQSRDDLQLESSSAWSVFIVSYATAHMLVETLQSMLRLLDRDTLVPKPAPGKRAPLEHKLRRIAERAVMVFRTGPAPSSAGLRHPDDFVDFYVSFRAALEKQGVRSAHTAMRAILGATEAGLAEGSEQVVEGAKVALRQSVQQTLGQKPNVYDVDGLVAWMLVQLATLGREEAAGLDLDRLFDDMFRWDGGRDPEADLELRDEFLDLVQLYHSRILEADKQAAATVRRVHSAQFLAGLAGRRPTAEEAQSFMQRVLQWRQNSVRRTSVDVLGRAGMTRRRFEAIVVQMSRRDDRVRKLDEDWRTYFKSRECLRNTWSFLEEPVYRPKVA